MKPSFWTIRRTALAGAVLAITVGLFRMGDGPIAFELGGLTAMGMLGAIFGALVARTFTDR